VAGINVSQGLSLLDAPRIISLMSGNAASIPVVCTVNLDVQNPNATDAILSGMDYTLAIDGIDFTSGTMSQQLSVAPGGTGVLPVVMAFDVATLLRGESRDAVMGVVRNLAGLGGLGAVSSGEQSKVTLNIRPSFNVAGSRVSSPVFIPVSFSFGGR
jgi:LEA14-like dessication related protein